MKNIFYPFLSFVLLFILFISSSCKKKDDSPAVSACFQVDQTESTDSTHNFVFTNCTGPYNTYQWKFGDGNTSADMNPTHRFNRRGTFTVQMTATNSDGSSGINTRVITIGHNTLQKVIYERLNSQVNFPKHVYLIGAFNLDNYVTASSLIPLTVNLADNVMYDVVPATNYLFKEDDFAGNAYTSSFSVSDFDIVGGVISKIFPYAGDTSKVSLYYKIVPR